MRLSTPEYVKELAKGLRKSQTPAESLLWEKLRANRLDGHKFYRQCPIGRYISDFFCGEINLVIELDGAVHDQYRQREYDKVRQQEIEGRNMTVLRFRNEQVLYDMESVLDTIRLEFDNPRTKIETIGTKSHLIQTPPPPTLLWGRGPGGEGPSEGLTESS